MNRKVFSVLWYFTEYCNLNCWFCNSLKKNIPQSLDHYLKIVKFLNEISDKIIISGGEPILNEISIFDILYKFSTDKKIIIRTNLEYDIKILKKLPQIKKDYDIKIEPTFHANFSNSDIFFDKIKFLNNNSLLDKIHFTFEKLDFKYIYENYKYLYDKIKNFDDNIKFYMNVPNVFYSESNLDDFVMINNIINKIGQIFQHRITNISEYCQYTCKNYSDFLTVSMTGDIYLCYHTKVESFKIPIYNILTAKDPIKIHNLYSKIKDCSFIYKETCKYLK